MKGKSLVSCRCAHRNCKLCCFIRTHNRPPHFCELHRHFTSQRIANKHLRRAYLYYFFRFSLAIGVQGTTKSALVSFSFVELNALVVHGVIGLACYPSAFLVYSPFSMLNGIGFSTDERFLG